MKSILFIVASVVLATTQPAAAAGPAAPGTQAVQGVVFQVSVNDPAKWTLTLNNITNAIKALPQGTLRAEIVAYGPGIRMLTDDSIVAERVRATIAAGVRVVACENTMAAMQLKHDDMLTGVDFVPAGVVEIIERQQQGYAYIRP